jgi:hypothetical protein
MPAFPALRDARAAAQCADAHEERCGIFWNLRIVPSEIEPDFGPMR